MRARRKIVAAVALVVAGGAAATATMAAATGTAWAAPVSELSVAAGVDSAYDGNVFNGRGPDYVNRISPQASWRLRDPRVVVDTSYLLGYWTYALGKAENSLNHRAQLAIDTKLSRRVTLQLVDELVRAEDPGFLSRTGVVAPQIGITQNFSEALVGVALAHRLYGIARYRLTFATFDRYTAEEAARGLPPLYDGAEHDATMGLSYRVTRLDTLNVGARFQHFSAGPQHESIAAFAVANTYTPTVGWEHRFLPTLVAGLEAGPLVYQALDGANAIPRAPKESGVTWRMAARVRYTTPSWWAMLSYNRDLLGATGAGSALWADHVYGQVGYLLAGRLDAHAGAGYFRNGIAVNQEFSYQGVTADVLVDWRVIRYLHLGAYYTVRYQLVGPGAVAPGMEAGAFPVVTRQVVGVRLLAVLGANARPVRRAAP
jgi:hypothetical protein